MPSNDTQDGKPDGCMAVILWGWWIVVALTVLIGLLAVVWAVLDSIFGD